MQLLQAMDIYRTILEGRHVHDGRRELDKGNQLVGG